MVEEPWFKYNYSTKMACCVLATSAALFLNDTLTTLTKPPKLLSAQQAQQAWHRQGRVLSPAAQAMQSFYTMNAQLSSIECRAPYNITPPPRQFCRAFDVHIILVQQRILFPSMQITVIKLWMGFQTYAIKNVPSSAVHQPGQAEKRHDHRILHCYCDE